MGSCLGAGVQKAGRGSQQAKLRQAEKMAEGTIGNLANVEVGTGVQVGGEGQVMGNGRNTGVSAGQVDLN